MSFVEIAAILVTTAALLSYINYRYVGLPSSIGVMVLALVASLALLALDRAGLGLHDAVQRFLGQINFEATLLHGMLAFLLFAGAIKIDLSDLRTQRVPVLVLSTVGVLLSTFIVGALTYASLKWLDVPMPFIYCLLFGALISPTDPVAVLAILKTAGVSKAMEIKVAGESLFNDGVAVVVFLLLLSYLHPGEHDVSLSHVTMVALIETVGAVILGLALGGVTYYLLKRVTNYQVEILMTLAMTMGGYALAERLHTSAPITIVVAGLLIGNQGRSFAMNAETREHLDTFWELIDEILNVTLFVLIGLEILVLPLERSWLLAAACAVPIALLARLGSVAIVVAGIGRWHPMGRGTLPILFWGGLKGGISVAMALSIPSDQSNLLYRELILVLAYAVVVFSIIVQGLTIAPVARRFAERASGGEHFPPPAAGHGSGLPRDGDDPVTR